MDTEGVRGQVSNMRLAAAIFVFLAACSSDDGADVMSSDGGSSEGSTGDDVAEGGTEAGSSDEGSTGTTEDSWPPICLEATPTSEATCGVLELVIDGLECEPQDAVPTITEIEVLWYQIVVDVGRVQVDTTRGGCGERQWLEAPEQGSYYARVAVTWTFDDVQWSCVHDGDYSGASSPTIVGLGREEIYELQPYDLPYPNATSGGDPMPPPPPWEFPDYGYGCCLLSGQPTDAYVQTPCEGA